MNNKLLYLGDTALDGAASYLAGIMKHHGLDFGYLPSDHAFESSLLDDTCEAIIISDYPASNFTPEQLSGIADKVKSGMGLLMIGGWESFTGLEGGYNNTLLKDALPVAMASQDDRVNYCGPCLVAKNLDHPILSDLPFVENATVIGGFNRFKAKADSKVLLSAKQYSAAFHGGEFTFTPQKTDPLLVAGEYGNGRTLAFASDVAPHWVGGLVDWGNQRVVAQADGAEQIEVGNWYAEFFANMIRWVMKQEIK